MWEGFFSPTETGLHRFRIRTANCYTFEFEREAHHTNGTGNKYEELKRCNLTKDVSGSNSNGAGDSIVLAVASDTVNVSVGMSASTSGTNRITNTALVESVNTATGVITFEDDSNTNPVTGNFSGSNNVTFFKSMGQQTTDIIDVSYVLTPIYSMTFL